MGADQRLPDHGELAVRFELLGRTLLPRTPLPGAGRGAFWGTGPFVCAVLMQIPIASTATK